MHAGSGESGPAAVATPDRSGAGPTTGQFAESGKGTEQGQSSAITGTVHAPTDAASGGASDAASGDRRAPVPAVGGVGNVADVRSPAGSTGTPVDPDGLDVPVLAASISRPLAQGNGDYSVSVSLHPPQLGEVRALLSLRGDELQVTLSPEMAVGHDALEKALPALHDLLTADGLRVSVSLGDPRGGPGDRAPTDGTRPGRDPGNGTPAPAEPFIDSTPAPDGDGRIHLVL
jgi:hypothetical protein